MFCHRLYVLSVLICVNTFCIPQSIEKIQINKYTQSNGLSSYNIRKIIQDKNYFLWFATQEGLSRFDGNQFKNYSKNSPPLQKLLGTDIRDLLEDPDHHLLWILSSTGGINAVDLNTGNIKISFALNNRLEDAWNMCMAKGMNELWIGTHKGLNIFDVISHAYTAIPLSPGGKTAGEPEVSLLINTPGGNMIACTEIGIFLIDASKKTIISQTLFKPEMEITLRFFSSVKQQKNKYLLATSAGLKCIRIDTTNSILMNNQSCTILPSLNNAEIKWICESGNGILIATNTDLYSFSKDLKQYSLLEERGVDAYGSWTKKISCLYIDKEQNTWMGCLGGAGLIKADKSPFTAFTPSLNNQYRLNYISTLYMPDSNTVIAGLRDGLVSVNVSSGKTTQIDSNHYYYNISKWEKGELIMSNNKAACIFKKKGLTALPETYNSLLQSNSITFNSVVNYARSTYVLGTENNSGILMLNTNKKQVRKINETTKPLALKSNIVNYIYKDKLENLWVLSDELISIISNNLTTVKTINFDINKVKQNFFFDVCEARNAYWVASYSNGILQLDKDYKLIKKYGIKDGLCNEGVYKIFNVGDSCLYITTNNGLSVFNLDLLAFRNYYEADGLHSNAFEEACGIQYNNKIVAGGVGGFTVIDPSFIQKNHAIPHLFINGLTYKTSANKTFDSANIHLSFMEIPAGAIQTTVFFNGINYANASATKYAYKIKELQTSWLALGNQNFIDLIGLYPGTYTLQVKAANEDGVWCQPKELILNFLPKWYQTTWFKLSIALLILLMMYSLYRYRLYQLQREEAIRTRIAADLHDDIGATLTSVRVFTDLGLAKNSTEYFPQIKQGVQEAGSSLRDIIWVLDKSNNNAMQLMERISRFAYPLTKAADCHFEIIQDDGLETVELGTELRRDLYLMMKEFITNSIKYAACGQILITVKKQKKQLCIFLQDDGCGFDMDTVIHGNGLHNIVKRAAHAGYKATFTSQPGIGTSLALLPL